jgi:HSP90 family molecular chaperone
MPAQSMLKFKVAPHIVEDLGLNLYTSLPRVLVEFIANAYDADSPYAHVKFDKDSIDAERKVLKARWEEAKAKTDKEGGTPPRLAAMTLPETLTIAIEDAGHGMTRADLENKFLIAGLRRRGADNLAARSNGGRVLMGRKGLGKLAGFG